MKRCGLFEILLIAAAILTDSLCWGQVNVEPNTALLNEGDRTELLCRYGRTINYCRIEIPGEKVLNLSPDWNNKVPGFTYYGDGLTSGHCGVSIDRVKAINNGQVKCNLGVEGEEFTGTIELVVAMRPQQPIIELMTKPDRDGYFSEGSLFEARCTVHDGRPAANITWLIDEYPADKRHSDLQVIPSESQANLTLFTSVQQIQWHLAPEDNGRKLICRSHHQTDRENIPPQEGAYQLLVRYAPIRQNEALVYGLFLDHTALVNMTIRSNPAPVVEWVVDGDIISQASQLGRFSVYEPQYIGHDTYNVTMAIAGLTLEDTTKTYTLRASNALGQTDYAVRLSLSSTPPTAGLDIGAIVGIVVAIAVLLVIVLLIVFARATGRWCFGGKSLKTPTNETSDTESADFKATSVATTATTAAASDATAPSATNGDAESSAAGAATTTTATKKSKRFPSLTTLLKRINERDSSAKKKDSAAAAATTAHPNEDDEPKAEETATATPAGAGKADEPKEDKQLVYAELVLKPAENQEPPVPPKPATEYAEIVYVQKPDSKK